MRRFRGRSPSTIRRASAMSVSSIGVKLTPGRFTISRNSLVVNDTWAGPLRPTADTLRIRLARSFSTTGLGMSVCARASGDLSSMRATSMATLPWPITVAWSMRDKSRVSVRWVYAG